MPYTSRFSLRSLNAVVASTFCVWTFSIGANPVAVSKAESLRATKSKISSLPVPEGLQIDVQFWERVFSEISTSECLFHDSWNLSVTYSIEKVPKIGDRNRLKVIQVKKAKIKGALRRFAAGMSPSNSFERKIYFSVPKEQRVRAFFSEAKDRVRCQRGVDLRPSLVRSQKYLNLVRRELISNGIPDDLAYLPHLESGFDSRAHSRAGAKGIWQFTKSGAKFAGLRVQSPKKGARPVDDRLDPARATKAAAQHLAEIYENTGSWPLAITAYNYGHNGVARAIAKYGADYMKIRTYHKTRIFGFASRNYYPSFLAVRNVAKKYEDRVLNVSGKQVAMATTATSDAL